MAAVNRGLDKLRQIFDQHGMETEFEEHELVERLSEFRETLRKKFAVGKTLDEQLEEAIAAERYEEAANLRDAIRAKRRGEI